MSDRIHEYLTIERWEPYKEENGSGHDFKSYLYCLPSYRLERLIAEAQDIHKEIIELKELLKRALDCVSACRIMSEFSKNHKNNETWQAFSEIESKIQAILKEGGE